MRPYALVVAGLLLAACKTTAERAQETLGPYVGKPISDVIAKNGPPKHSYDVGPGERAFQWHVADFRTGTGMVVPVHGMALYMPPQTHMVECRITFTAKAAAPQPLLSQWIIQAWQYAGQGC